MKPNASLRLFLALAGSSLMAVSSASAQTIVNWEGDTNTAWATATNWDFAPTSSLTANIANFNLATYGGNPVFAPTVGTATSIAGITIGAGNGTMTLTNTAALSIGASGISIANGAGAFTISGSTTLGAAQSWTNNSANLFTFGAVTNGGNLLTIGGSGNITASGVIGNGAGGLTKEGAGLLTLNAANTYTGATTVDGGELRWGIANAIAGGALNVNDGGTVNMQGFSDTVGTVTIAKGGSITGTGGTLTTGSGGFASNNGGTMTGSTLLLATNAGVTYNSTGPGSTTMQIDRLSLADATTTHVFNIADGDAAIDFEITGTLTGGGNNVSNTITKTGAGVMQFSGSAANTKSQNQMPLNINEGTVIFNKSAEVNALPNGTITIGDGTGSAGSAMLQYRTSNNQITDNTITINSDGLFDLNGKSETISTSGGALTMNGGSITTGAGTLTLGNVTNTIRGASTVTGNLTFTPGTVAATNLTLGGTASINGTTTFSGGNGSGITATGSTSIAGTLAFGTSSRTIAVNAGSDTLTITANITGSGALTKNGAGTLQIGDGTTAGTMSSTSAFTIGGGTLAILAPTTGSSSQTVASLATTASTNSIIRLTPGASGNTTLTITSGTLSTGAGSSLNFDYTAGTTVGGTVGNNYVVWSPTLTGGIIGGAYTVTDSGGTGFATRNGSNIVRLTDPGGAGLPVSTGSATGSYFIGSDYSTDTATTPGSLVEALSGAVAASNVTVNTTGLASGANLALGTNLLTLGAGMVISGPNAYEISGSGAGGLKAASTGGTINLYNASTGTVTISAPIVNNSTSRLTVDGSGTTILSGVNTYTGATVLNGGTVKFSGTMAASAVTINNNGVAQLGTATGLTSSNTVTFGAGSTGSLQLLGNSLTIGALNSNATLGTPVITNNNGGGAVANATLTINSASASTFGGVIQDGAGGGTLALAKSGTGTLTLSGTNTFTGGLVLNGGTLAATSDANLGASVASAALITAAQAITVNGNSTLALGSGGVTYNRSILLNSGILAFPGSGNNPTISGAVTGSGGVSINGGNAVSSVTLGSTGNTFTGAVNLGLGTAASSTGPTITVASLADSASLGAGNITFNYTYSGTTATFAYSSGAVAPLTLNNRQIVVANTLANITSKIQNNNTTNAITINTPLSVTTATTGTHTLNLDAVAGPVNVFGGTVSDGGAGVLIAVSKSGAGTWMLSNASNSYTGGTTVSGGKLIMTSPASLGNGALNVGANTFIYSPTTAGALNIGTGVLTLSGTIGTAVGGTASQSAITSTGTAVLSGTTGKVNIYGITGVAPTAGPNNLITAGGGLGGGTFALGTVYNNTDFTVSAISRSGTAISTIVTLATPLSGGVYWKGGLSGNTGVWSASTGLSGGTSNWQVTDGVNQPLAPGASADLIFSASTSPGTMAGMTLGANMRVRSLTVNNTATAFGLNNDGYKLTITPDVSTKGITLNAGLADSPTIAANIELGAAQTWTNNSGRTFTVSGIVSGANNLTTTGADTITLTADNTYTGATTITGGILQVSGSGDINQSSGVTIGSGATFRYNSSVAYSGGTITNNGGTIAGTGDIGVTIGLDSTSDILAPGNSPGIQEYTVGQSWASFTYQWEVNDFDGTTAGTDFDQIQITGGGLMLTGGTAGSYVLDLVSLAGLLNTAGVVADFSETTTSWNILTASGGISGFNEDYWTIDTSGFTTSNNPDFGGTWSLSATTNNLVLTYTAVPEPRAALLGGLGLLMLLRRRRLQ